MKKLLMSLILSVAVLGVASGQSAGKFEFGVKAGVNISNMPGLGSPKEKIGFTGGLTAGYEFENNLGVGLEALYYQGGCKGKDSDSGLDGVVSIDYVAIPVLVSYNIAGSGFKIKTGLQTEIPVSSKYSVGSGSEDLKAKMDYYTMSVPVGLSYDIGYGVVAEARYNIGVKDVFARGAKLSSNSNVISITIGKTF